MTNPEGRPRSLCNFGGDGYGSGDYGGGSGTGEYGQGEYGNEAGTGGQAGSAASGGQGTGVGAGQGEYGTEAGTGQAGGAGMGEYGTEAGTGGQAGAGPGGGGTSDGGNAPFGGGEEFGGYSGLETGGPAAGVGPEGDPAAYGGFGDPTAGAYAEGPGGPSTTGGPAEGPSSLADMATQGPAGPWGPVGGFDEMLSTILGPAITSPLEAAPYGRAEPAGMPGRAMGPTETGFPFGAPSAPFGGFATAPGPAGPTGGLSATGFTDQGAIANALGMGTGALAGGVSSTALGGAPSAGFTGWEGGVQGGTFGPGVSGAPGMGLGRGEGEPSGTPSYANPNDPMDINPLADPEKGLIDPGIFAPERGPQQAITQGRQAALDPAQPLGRQGTMESLDILGRGRGISPEDIMNVSPDVWGRAAPEARGPAYAQGQLGPAWNTQSLFSPSPLAGRDVEAEAREEAEIQGRFGPQEMRGPEVTAHVNPLDRGPLENPDPWAHTGRASPGPGIFGPLSTAYEDYGTLTAGRSAQEHANPMSFGLYGIANPADVGRGVAEAHANPMSFGLHGVANPADIGRGVANLGLNPVSEVNPYTMDPQAFENPDPGRAGRNANPFSDPKGGPPGPFSQTPAPTTAQQMFSPAPARGSPQSFNPEGRDPFGRGPAPLSVTVTPGQRGPAPGPAPSRGGGRGGGRGGPAPGIMGPAPSGRPGGNPYDRSPASFNAPFGITSLPGLQGLSPGQIAALEAMVAEQQQAQAPIGAPSLFSMMG